MKITAQELFDKLINDEKILTKEGRITFNLGDIDIIVRQKDVVGNIMQEWVEGWLKSKGYVFAPNPNTQMPPDFFLDPAKKDQELLEVKAFNYKQSPGFDIADFKMFEKEIVEKPYMLHVSYLIFGYDMSDYGIVTIKKMWLENVWELCRPMYSGSGAKKCSWPINLQIKEGKVHKIRPGKWYGKSTQFKHYDTLEHFLSAIEETVYQNPETHNEGPAWKQRMVANYKKKYNKDLTIPKWEEIKSQYLLK